MTRYLIAIPAALLLAGPGVAQVGHESSDVHLRNDCRLAVQVLRTGHPHPKHGWASEFIARCRDSGPAALVQLWATLPADTSRVYDVLWASARLRDQRLFDQAASLVQDPSRPEVVRVGAMILLVQYAKSEWRGSFALLTPPAQPVHTVRMILGGHSTHPIPQVNGTVPLPRSVASSVLRVLQQTAAIEKNPRVWYAAAALAKTLSFDIEKGFVR